MGPAHSTVVNQTAQSLCVISFNMADLLYKTYHTMYIVGPGESAMIEANPDAIGLKLGIIYQTEKERNELLFHRFTCNNDSILTITLINGENIIYFGDHVVLNSKGKLREMSYEPFNMAASTLRNEEIDPSRNESKIKNAILKVKDTVIDSSEQIIKNVTGREVHLIESSSNQNLAYADTKGRSPAGKSSAPHMGANGTAKAAANSHGFNSSPEKHAVASSNSNDAPSRLKSERGLRAQELAEEEEELSPEEAARKWEEELERVKREKKWEAELVRIKRERELAKSLPPASPPPRLETSISSLTSSPANNLHSSSSIRYEPTKTAPVADTSCSVCVIS